MWRFAACSHISVISLLICLVCLFPSNESKFRSFKDLSSWWRKPTCRIQEPCSLEIFVGKDMSMCNCPENAPCPSKNNVETTLFYRGVSYQFCEPTHFHVCEKGELAWTHHGLHKRLHCICMDPFQPINSNWDPFENINEYICDMRSMCSSANATCKSRIRMEVNGRPVSHLQAHCGCPMDTNCKETKEQTTEGDVRFDIWRCVED